MTVPAQISSAQKRPGIAAGEPLLYKESRARGLCCGLADAG